MTGDAATGDAVGIRDLAVGGGGRSDDDRREEDPVEAWEVHHANPTWVVDRQPLGLRGRVLQDLHEEGAADVHTEEWVPLMEEGGGHSGHGNDERRLPRGHKLPRS